MAARKKKSKTTRTQGKPVAKTRDMTELVDLTVEAVRALAKPRQGFEDHAEPLFELWTTHERALGQLAIGVDEARERLARYQALAVDEAAVRADLEVVRKRLEMVVETRALQASKVWSVMLDIYAKSKLAGKSDSQIAAEIKPFVAFMAIRPGNKGG